MYPLVCRGGNLLEVSLRGALGDVAGVECLCGEARCDLPGPGAAHAVGNGEHRGTGEERVLVCAALPAGVRALRLVSYSEHRQQLAARRQLVLEPELRVTDSDLIEIAQGRLAVESRSV